MAGLGRTDGIGRRDPRTIRDGVLHDADPADKAETFRRLGLKLTYHPGQRLVQATVEPAQYGFFDSPRGALKHANQ